jgi:hypothetical protein
MKTAIIHSNSESDFKLLIDLAKKIGIKTQVLSATDSEELGLAEAIQHGRTRKYTDTGEFLKKLRK